MSNSGYIQKQAAKSREIRHIKQPKREKTPAEYISEHEIALLRLLARKYPQLVKELIDASIK